MTVTLCSVGDGRAGSFGAKQDAGSIQGVSGVATRVVVLVDSPGGVSGVKKFNRFGNFQGRRGFRKKSI